MGNFEVRVANWTRLEKLCCQRHRIHDSGSQGRKVLMSVLVVSLAVWKKGYFVTTGHYY
jgi:hypothetical protein